MLPSAPSSYWVSWTEQTVLVLEHNFLPSVGHSPSLCKSPVLSLSESCLPSLEAANKNKVNADSCSEVSNPNSILVGMHVCVNQWELNRSLLVLSAFFNCFITFFHAEVGVKTWRVDTFVSCEKGCPDLSALLGNRHSASSTAPSSPPPPCRSGCTAGVDIQSQADDTPFHNKGTHRQVKAENSRPVQRPSQSPDHRCRPGPTPLPLPAHLGNNTRC